MRQPYEGHPLADPMTPVTKVVGGDGQSQRAFGPAHRVLVGRTDERAWTAVATRNRHHHGGPIHAEYRSSHMTHMPLNYR